MREHPKGQTVLFITTAIGMLILLVAAGVLNIILPSYREANSDINSTKAEYLALGALEKGKYEVYKNGPGYENDWVEIEAENGATAKYRVVGRSQTEFGVDQYAIPEPSTGNAGGGCEGYAFDDGDWEDDLDNPCNWNKLEFGDTGVIPLYMDTGEEIVNPSDVVGPGTFRLDEMYLKIRTPCKEGTEDEYGGCDASDRYELDCGTARGCNFRDYTEGDDTIINWEIKGLCNGGSESCAILAVDWVVDGSRHEDNTEISEALINNERFNDFYVLSVKPTVGFDNGDKGKVIKEGEELIYDFVTDADLIQPVLQFSIINRLTPKDQFVEIVPYLEYQIVYKSSEPMPNNMRYIEAIGESNGYTIRLLEGIGQEGSVSGFVIQN